MKRAIGLLAFGLLLGTTWCLGADERLLEAEAWSAENLDAGVVHFDLSMQIRLNADFSANLARAQTHAESYIGRMFQYTGRVFSVTRHANLRGDIIHFQIHMTRADGVTVFAQFGLDQAESVFQVNVGYVITVVGRCLSFMARTGLGERGLSAVTLEDSVIKRVAD